MADQVRVDGQAVTVGSSIYALENIALAVAVKSPNMGTGIVMVILGLLPALLLVVTGNTNGLCLAVFGGVVVLGLGIALFGGSLWWVYVETKQGKRKRIWSAPEARAQALAEEINRALERGSSRVIE